jgi:hypothetical protein
MLWRLDKNGRTSWIGGSAHFFCTSFEYSLRRLFENVDTVLLEGPIDSESMDEVDRIGRTLEPGAPRVIDFLSEEDVRRVERMVYGPEGWWARLYGSVQPRRVDVREVLSTRRQWSAFFTLWTAFLERNGWNNSFLRLNISPVEISKALLSSPALEMLAKTQRELFLHLLRTGRTEFPVHAVKICNRNNYRIADPDIWLDHIDNLLRLNLDTHNAHYVCPADIYAEHERLANRIRSEEKKKELEARRAEMKKMETEYQETKGKFFGICFGNENIVVTVIQSVQEMEHEGTAMHHCVYVNEYYKKAHSLILSAKDKRGNRIETVEVNTQIFKVVQSRGVCNQNTPHHNEIINLVNNNMYRIRQAI